MSEELQSHMLNSMNDKPKSKRDNIMSMIATALANPEVVAQSTYDPDYEAVKSSQKDPVINTSFQPRSAEDISHPERAGLAIRQRKIDKEKQYAQDIANIPNNEIENLFDLMRNDGRRIIEAKLLKKMAEESGIVIETSNLEKLELIKRNIIQDDGGWLIEFIVTKEGKRIYGMLRQFFENKMNRQ